MTSQRDIEIQIAAEKQTFYLSKFDGKLPSDLIERFEKALMVSAPGQHQYHMDKVKLILSKEESELNYLELGMVINLLFSVPFDKLYSNLDEALEKNIELESVRIVYNTHVKETEDKLIKKKNILMNLSGVTKAPLKLIKAEA